MELRMFCCSTNLLVPKPKPKPNPPLHFSSSKGHSFLRPLQTAVTSPSLFLLACPKPKPKPKPLLKIKCSNSNYNEEDDWPPIPQIHSSLELKKKAMYMGDGLKGTSIFLIGMKSYMKTYTGKLLSEALGYYYFDSDELVEEAAGGAANVKLMKETDDKAYRESETQVLKELSAVGRLVVCAGDGAVESAFNLTLLRDGISIWIEVPLDRLGDGLVEENSEVLARLAEQYQSLKGRYASADTTISLQKVAAKLGYSDLDEVTADNMALEVLSGIEKLTRYKKLMEEAATPF